MPDRAGVIQCNLPRARRSYDQELSLSAREERVLAAADLRTADHAQSVQAQEEGQRLHEQTVQQRRVYQWKGQERWQGRENEEARLVRILHPNAVFRALRRAGVDARIESPTLNVWTHNTAGMLVPATVLRTTGRLWLNAAPRAGRIGVNAWVKDEALGRMVPETVTNLQEPYGPEWTLVRFDQWNVPTEAKYQGWRTAMLTLILRGVLTEDEVDRAFGKPVIGPASEWYREQLQIHRSRSRGWSA